MVVVVVLWIVSLLVGGGFRRCFFSGFSLELFREFNAFRTSSGPPSGSSRQCHMTSWKRTVPNSAPGWSVPGVRRGPFCLFFSGRAPPFFSFSPCCCRFLFGGGIAVRNEMNKAEKQAQNGTKTVSQANKKNDAAIATTTRATPPETDRQTATARTKRAKERERERERLDWKGL